MNVPELAFPVLIMTLYVLSAATYAYHGTFDKAAYWICAFGITFTVTFPGAFK